MAKPPKPRRNTPAKSTKPSRRVAGDRWSRCAAAILATAAAAFFVTGNEAAGSAFAALATTAFTARRR